MDQTRQRRTALSARSLEKSGRREPTEARTDIHQGKGGGKEEGTKRREGKKGGQRGGEEREKKKEEEKGRKEEEQGRARLKELTGTR